ncbi:laccase-2-like [Thrips palmi]|uniref:Laccase-2-like n=1 Tax=Thrips palmi TaxID=161013 RepID=A0A6P8ZBL2_THRPL|nr:laccase-2-like [Thrips palmi]
MAFAATFATLLALFALVLQHAQAQKWRTDLGPCYRDCTEDPEPRLCYYVFTEEIYSVLTGACGNCSRGVEEDCFREQCVFADGVERTVYTVNRQLPGPGIHVCRGDVIRVDLAVELPGHAEAIHWHGLPQAWSPWFDGVSHVTQCPIIFGTTFRYQFLAEPAGTYFWHSHSGVHKVNGISGPLIIKEYEPPHAELYDYDLPEHVIFLQDWMHVDAEFVLPGLATRLTGQPSDSLLINGQGTATSAVSNRTTLTPMARFEIQPGKRYRFRIINAGSLSCPIQLQFEGHNMTVIASDGWDIKPRRAQSLITLSGERYDVVIHAQRRPTVRAFWIYARTVGFCQNRGGTEQRAVLAYQSSGVAAPRTPPTAPPGIRLGRQLPTGTVVNTPGDCESESNVCAAELEALEWAPYCTDVRYGCSRADHLVFFRLGFVVEPPETQFSRGNYDRFLAFGPVTLTGVLNDIAYVEPSSPFLTQPGQAAFCSEGYIPRHCRGKQSCSCSHLVEVPYGQDIDLIVVDETDLNPGDNTTTLLAHPMHLHGYSSSFMGMGTLRDVLDGKERAAMVRDLYDRELLPTFVASPAIKDAMALPGGGWIWIRFHADNRGDWFFHCHFQYHMISGMEAVIQVGESRYLPRPPAGFPRCGNYRPSDY